MNLKQDGGQLLSAPGVRVSGDGPSLDELRLET